MHASAAGEARSSGRAVAERGRRQYIIMSYCVMACCSSYPNAALAVALRRGGWPESLQPDPLAWRRVQLPVLATSSSLVSSCSLAVPVVAVFDQKAGREGRGRVGDAQHSDQATRPVGPNLSQLVVGRMQVYVYFI